MSLDPRHRLLALTAASALFLQNLDATILGVALPAIAKTFGESPMRMHLVLTSYLLSLALGMPLSGWIAGKFGARKTYVVAIAIFTVASIACALAHNSTQMIAARLVQGLGGALMVPVARLALLRTLPKREMVSAMTWVTVPALVGPLIGPPLGGLLVTYAGWPWVFWINLPIGILAIIMGHKFIPNLYDEHQPPLDVMGCLLSAIAICGIVIGCESLAEPWPAWVGPVTIASGLIAALAYVWHAKRCRHPILDLELLRVPTFRASVLGGTWFRIGIGALPFLFPLMLQLGFGKSALASGMITLAGAGGAIGMKFLTERVLLRFGFKRVLVTNCVLSGASIAACAMFTPSTPALVMFVVLLIGGFFRSMQFTAINAIAYADLNDAGIHRSTGLAAMAQQMAFSIGIGFGASILHSITALRGREIANAQDFPLALLIVGVVVMLGSWNFSRLATHAGDEVAGRATSVGGKDRVPSDPRV